MTTVSDIICTHVCAQNLVLSNDYDSVRAMAKQTAKLKQVTEFDLSLVLEILRVFVSQMIKIMKKSLLVSCHFLFVLHGTVSQ